MRSFVKGEGKNLGVDTTQEDALKNQNQTEAIQN